MDDGRLVINNAGEIAGTAGGRVALWRRSSGLEYMTDSGEAAILTDMNDVGQLVGSSGAQPTIWQLGRQPRVSLCRQYVPGVLFALAS